MSGLLFRGVGRCMMGKSGGGWSVADVRDVVHGCVTFLC